MSNCKGFANLIIYSALHHQKEKSLCVRDKAKDLCWMPSDDALGQHCITHRHDSVIDITKWAQEYFQKSLSVNTIRHAICRCQLNLYHAKSKPYVNMVQKRRRVLWAKVYLELTDSKWKRVQWKEGDLHACHQHSVQKPATLMVWGCISAYSMGSLHVLEDTMNAEMYIKVLEQHICSPPDDFHFRRTMQNHTLQLQQHGFVVEESGC